MTRKVGSVNFLSEEYARLANAVHQRHEVLVADRVQRRDDQLAELGTLIRDRVLPNRHLHQQRIGFCCVGFRVQRACESYSRLVMT